MKLSRMVNPLPPSSPGTEDALVAEAERLLRQGEPLLAYNAADTGLQRGRTTCGCGSCRRLRSPAAATPSAPTSVLTELARGRRR